MKLENICTNCQLVTSDDGNKETIFSYGTPVLSVVWNGEKYRLKRHWDGYSATTLKHINKAFTANNGTSWYPDFLPLRKKEWDAMSVEEA